MNNRINQNPQNGGNEQQMQNQAQTNGQVTYQQKNPCFEAMTLPTNLPNYNGQDNLYQQNVQTGSDCQQYNNWQYQWYDNSSYQYDYPENIAFDSPTQENYFECYEPPRQKSGQLFNLLRATQPIDYSDMDCDGCTPTNVDGGLDVKQQGFVLIEMKCLPRREKWLVQTGRLYPPNRIPQPQKIYLECDIDAKQRGDSPSALFLADHDVFDPHQTVNAAYTIVLAVYYHGRGYIAKNRRILKDCVRFFWNAVLNGEGDNLDWYYANNF